MPWWVELVSIVLPVALGLGVVFLKTSMQRRKSAGDRSEIDDRVETALL